MLCMTMHDNDKLFFRDLIQVIAENHLDVFSTEFIWIKMRVTNLLNLMLATRQKWQINNWICCLCYPVVRFDEALQQEMDTSDDWKSRGRAVVRRCHRTLHPIVYLWQAISSAVSSPLPLSSSPSLSLWSQCWKGKTIWRYGVKGGRWVPGVESGLLCFHIA